MHIYCLGLNHNTTPIELREQFSLSEDAIRSALARLACGHLATSIGELVIISTCNRTELYAASSHMAIRRTGGFFVGRERCTCETVSRSFLPI
jgi:glutamyl-tRNA reductase